MKHKIFCFLVTAVVVLHSCAAQTAADTSKDVVAFISDTQAPMWIESIALKRNQNERATRMLFDHILADSTIQAVVNFGDVTGHSASDKAWKFMDSVLVRAKIRHLGMYAAIGNHDYFFSAEEGERNFRKRFPDFRRTGYVETIHGNAFVLFNSNFNRLSKVEQQTQLAWYTATLDSLERDSSIISVFVGCHHPPFTNNTIVGGSADVRNQYVPPFVHHAKCKLFLSGHAHAFEHFQKSGKDFVVLGGGGGLQHTLLLGDQQREKDLFPQQTEKRMFHYLRCEITSRQITITVMMVRKDFSGIDPVYQFTVPR